MRLLYLYVEYKSEEVRRHHCALNKINLNFDSAYRFSMCGNKLSYRKGVAISSEFYSKRKGVDSISAVVGANGEGKTAVARVLSQLIQNCRYFKNFVLIVDYGQDAPVCATSFSKESITGFKCRVIHEVPKELRLVYLSNHFSEIAQIEADGSRVVDLSTSGLLMNPVRQDEHKGMGDSDLAQSSNILLYKADQVRWAAEFAAHCHKDGHGLKKQTDVRLPYTIRISVNYKRMEALRRYYDLKAGGRFSKGEDMVCRLLDVLNDNQSEGFFIDALAVLTGNYWYAHLLDADSCEEDEFARQMLDVVCRLSGKDYDDENPNVTEERSCEDLTASNIAWRCIKWLRRSRTGVQDNTNIVAFVQDLLDLVDRCDAWDMDSLSVKLADDNAVRSLSKMLGSYSRLTMASGLVSEMFLFDVEPGMSSGEFSYLTLWSRLYHWLSSGSQGAGDVVFIDEAETTLHPEWQRMLVSNMVYVLDAISPNASIHLIFASHSPILLSDIPSENVVYLGRPVGKNTAKSFGANIFDLYRNGFFLRNGTVGVFAQDKIMSLVDKVFSIVSAAKSKEAVSISNSDRRLVDMIADDDVARYLREWLKELDRGKNLIR